MEREPWETKLTCLRSSVPTSWLLCCLYGTKAVKMCFLCPQVDYMEPIVEKITLVEDARFDSPKSMFLGRVMGKYLVHHYPVVTLRDVVLGFTPICIGNQSNSSGLCFLTVKCFETHCMKRSFSFEQKLLKVTRIIHRKANRRCSVRATWLVCVKWKIT